MHMHMHNNTYNIHIYERAGSGIAIHICLYIRNTINVKNSTCEKITKIMRGGYPTQNKICKAGGRGGVGVWTYIYLYTIYDCIYIYNC